MLFYVTVKHIFSQKLAVVLREPADGGGGGRSQPQFSPWAPGFSHELRSESGRLPEPATPGDAGA